MPPHRTVSHTKFYVSCLTATEEIPNLLQFLRDKTTKKLHSEKYKEKVVKNAGGAAGLAHGLTGLATADGSKRYIKSSMKAGSQQGDNSQSYQQQQYANVHGISTPGTHAT